MTYLADLSPWTYGPPEYEVFLAVGWLDAEHPFTQGPVESRILYKLVELATQPWEPGHFMGFHTCELCPPSSTTLFGTRVTIGGRHLTLGADNLFIPHRRRIYVAPSLILHYIVSHGYQPPQAFLDAARYCPPMWSTKYEIWLRAGAPGLFDDPEWWPPYNLPWQPPNRTQPGHDNQADRAPSRWARIVRSCLRQYYILLLPPA